MAGCFVKMIGASDYPVPEGVDIFDSGGCEIEIVRFPTRQFPKQWTGNEQLIYYAVGGTKKIFAAARLAGAPVERIAQQGERWPHTAPVRIDPSTVIRDLRFAPELAEVDIELRDAIGKDVSWVQMTTQQFERACALLRRRRLSAPPNARRPL
jgi:hypothetical protein